jgi:hypothetical protein
MGAPAVPLPRLLQVDAEAANLCVSVELEHRHRVHEVGTLISDVSLFNFEVHVSIERAHCAAQTRSSPRRAPALSRGW